MTNPAAQEHTHAVDGRSGAAMIEIDGAQGEGGGQLVRNAVAVAAVTGAAIRITQIRAKRRNPGLAAQHAAAVRAVAALCDAQTEGVQPGSTTLCFRPRRLRGGEFEVDVGTAGSIPLVLQAMLPAAVATGERVVMNIRGGTDVRAAPPIDYLRLVLLPLLAMLGVQTELSIARRGYFPKGGGEVRLALQPVSRLRPFTVLERGPLHRIEAQAHVARLPRQIAERMQAAARAALPPGMAVQATIDVIAPHLTLGAGGAIVLRALAAHTLLGSAQVAERGVPAERLGQLAASALTRDLDAAATLDIHAADQMLVFLALADGPSAFRAAELSSHAATAIWLLEKLTPARFSVEPAAPGVAVRVRPK